MHDLSEGLTFVETRLVEAQHGLSSTSEVTRKTLRGEPGSLLGLMNGRMSTATCKGVKFKKVFEAYHVCCSCIAKLAWRLVESSLTQHSLRKCHKVVEWNWINFRTDGANLLSSGRLVSKTTVQYLGDERRRLCQ